MNAPPSSQADRTPSRIDTTSRITVGLVSVMLVVMLLRVAQLQLAPSRDLAQHMQSRETRRTVAAARGDIMDRRHRYLATTQFGYRVFIDPTEFPPESPANPEKEISRDEAIARLASATGVPAEKIGSSVISAMATNQARAAAAAANAPPAEPPKAGLIAAYSRLKALLAAARPAAKTTAAAGSDITPGDETDVSILEDDPAPDPYRQIRYVRVSDVLDDEVIEGVKLLRIPGVHLEKRSVREYPSGDLAASIIGKVGYENTGVLGAEWAHDDDLAGIDGKILYVRDARGRPLWMGPGAYDPAKRGKDLRLAIDLEIQRLSAEELWRGIEESDAAGGRLIVMDVATGEILAMVDLLRPVPDAVPFPWPDALPASRGQRGSGLLYTPPPAIPRARYITMTPDPGREILAAMGRNRCVEDVYEPGSTFKPFVWATITELGRVRPGEVIDTGNGRWITPYGRPIRDEHKHASLAWTDVLVQSSNIGMSKGAERLSHDELYRAVRRFGFGMRTGIELQSETAGIVTPRKFWSKYTQTSVSFGQEVAVTPVQMVRAFSVFARTGELTGTLPQARMTAMDEGDPAGSIVHKVVRPDVVMLVRAALRITAREMEAKMATKKGSPESGWRYSIFGKSGTAQIPLGKAPDGKRRPPKMGYFTQQYNSSFIAAGPAEDPKLVILVVIDDPGPELVRTRSYFGSHTAGPVVRRVMERSLAYLGVAPSPPASVAPLMAAAPR